MKGGWFPVHRADIERIAESTGERKGTVLAVWLALVDIGNRERTTTFKTPQTMISSLSGIKKSALNESLNLLEAIGMISRVRNTIPGTRELDLSSYTLHGKAGKGSPLNGLGSPQECGVSADSLKEEEKKQRKAPAKPDAVVFPESLRSEEFKAVWEEWTQHRAEIRKKLTPSTIKAQLAKLAKLGSASAIAVIHKSIEQGWIGLFEPKNGKATAEDLGLPKDTSDTGAAALWRMR